MHVSVIIPVFELAAWVEEAVDSCLRQPEVREILLVEDGSSDDSYEVCQSLARRHDRVRLLTHAGRENRGAAASLNLGVRSAAHPYVSFLDADDVYLPGRFRNAGERFAEDPSLDGVYDPVERVFEDEKAEARWRARGRLTRYAVRQPMAPEDLFAAWVGGHHGFFVVPGIVYNRAFLRCTAEFPEDMPSRYDSVLLLETTIAGRLVSGGSEDAVALARVHGSNLSSQHFERWPQLWTRVWEHILDWSRQRELAPGTRALIEEKFLWAIQQDGPLSARRWLGLLRRHPSLLRNRAFRKQGPVRAWLRRRRHSRPKKRPTGVPR